MGVRRPIERAAEPVPLQEFLNQDCNLVLTSWRTLCIVDRMSLDSLT